MNNTNARARIINEIFQTSEDSCNNDFSCYFLGSQNYVVPKYSVISQPDKAPVFEAPVYQTDGFKWKPHVLFSENLQTHETKHYTCKCENCRRDTCPSKSNRSYKKDNIMKFSDKGTMTRKLKDADCCCDFAKPCKMPDITNIEPKVDGLKCLERKCPRAILKVDPAYKCAGKICKNIADDQIAERDTEDNKLPKIDNKVPEFNEVVAAEELLDQRRTLYNEGISDQIANQFPIAAQRLPSPICINTDQPCKAPMKKPTKAPIIVKGIPYSHKIHSKYHETCKNASKNRLSFDMDLEDSKYLVAPDAVKGTLKSVRPVKVPLIKLPRKVLTSEKQIELYVDSLHPKARKHK